MRMNIVAEENLQLFGGDWTERKLDALGQYLRAYVKVLLNQPFETVYIDAFAGTGYREQKAGGEHGAAHLFQDLRDEEPQEFLEGSARIALQTQPGFSRYIFVEKGKRRARELEALKSEFSEQAGAIEILQEDANSAIQRISGAWNRRRARGVVFLDPFGMQVDWASIDAIASTRSIDVWILFPFAVNRLLTRDPKQIPAAWRRGLTRLFGSDDWLNRFYKQRQIDAIFGGTETPIEKKATMQGLGAYYMVRLHSAFPVVAPNPAMLENTRHIPLFQLFFAAANPGRGGDIALKIAKHILDRI